MESVLGQLGKRKWNKKKKEDIRDKSIQRLSVIVKHIIDENNVKEEVDNDEEDSPLSPSSPKKSKKASQDASLPNIMAQPQPLPFDNEDDHSDDEPTTNKFLDEVLKMKKYRNKIFGKSSKSLLRKHSKQDIILTEKVKPPRILALGSLRGKNSNYSLSQSNSLVDMDESVARYFYKANNFPSLPRLRYKVKSYSAAPVSPVLKRQRKSK